MATKDVPSISGDHHAVHEDARPGDLPAQVGVVGLVVQVDDDFRFREDLCRELPLARLIGAQRDDEGTDR